MLDDLVCPVSNARIDRNVVRVNGLMTTLLLAAYVFTAWGPLIAVVAIDYVFRARMSGPKSPMTRLAGALAGALGLPARPMDKASKVFASRIGLCFSVGAATTHLAAPAAAPWIAGTLALFTMLESVFDFCFGCVVYTYVALPLYRARDAVMRVPLFERLEDGMLVTLARGFQRVELAEDAALLTEGEPGEAMYVLLRGQVQVFHEDSAGGRRVVATRGPPEHVGEMALLSDEPRIAHVRASSAVTALRLGREDFERVVERHPAMRRLIERTAEERLRAESRDDALQGSGLR